MKVLKFGGSTLTGIQQIEQVLLHCKKTIQSHSDIVLVFSAFGGVTDQLIQLSQGAVHTDDAYLQTFEIIQNRHLEVIQTLIPASKQNETTENTQSLLSALKDTIHGVHLLKELSPKSLDLILSFGERLASVILAGCLKARSVPVEIIDPRTLIVTDDQFGKAKIEWDPTVKNARKQLIGKKSIPIVPGFIGMTLKGEITTLGRGGSDYTATLIGAALKAEAVEIWTDVDGIMTADPKKVAKSFPIDRLSWDEAMELSHFGAKLIFPPAMIPAARHNMPIYIRNILHADFKGTVIGSSAGSDQPVRGISSIDQIALLSVQGSGMMGVVGIANRLFSALAKNAINVILITQASSEHSICFAIAPDQAEAAKQAIEEEFYFEISAGHMDRVHVETDVSIIAVVGENMRQTPGIASRLFQALAKNGVNIRAIAQGSSELNISIVIAGEDESKALNALHEAFFLSDTKSLHLFIIGTGLIGGTLLKQIGNQQHKLRSDNALDIRLMGIGDVDHMVINEIPLPPRNWQDTLKKGAPMDLHAFITQMLNLNLPNTVFVDCTGSPAVVEYYKDIMDASISIVTPNKIANSGPYSQYKNLRDTAAQKGVKFLYEANVGAGLPVISTLNDLLCSGDTIVKIEAVLSGTLSYIFNSFTGEKKFSEVVKEAKARGLSEPDPRDDLNGLDVARKILILAREAGLPLEPEQIRLENILPESCQKAGDVEAFFQALKQADPQFSERRDAAAKQGQVLRYIAALENNQATVRLKGVDADHPFHALTGSDNMVVLTTERYHELPLVIKGPGAGAEVTAAGVFADIIRIANYLS